MSGTTTRPTPQISPPRPPVAQGAALASVAIAVPERVVPSEEIAARLGIDPAWIESRTGIRERRFVADDESLVDLASRAGQLALDRAGVTAQEIDLLLVGSLSQDAITPNAAPLVAARLGASRAGAMDVGAACTAWLSALALATSYVETGRADHALVIGADLGSRMTNFDDRDTAALFGDGAGAVVVRGHAGPSRTGPIRLGVDPEGAGFITISRSEGFVRMRGRETFEHATDRLVAVTREAIDAAGLTLEDIDVFAYHQANARILRAVARRLALDPERVPICIDRYGNTSAATVPMALDTALVQGSLAPGHMVLLASFGAGFTYGAAVTEWGGRA